GGAGNPAGTDTGQILWYDSYRAGRIRSFIAASWIRNRLSPDCFVYNTRLTSTPALPAITRPGSSARRQPVAFTPGPIPRATSVIGLASCPLSALPNPPPMLYQATGCPIPRSAPISPTPLATAPAYGSTVVICEPMCMCIPIIETDGTPLTRSA